MKTSPRSPGCGVGFGDTFEIPIESAVIRVEIVEFPVIPAGIVTAATVDRSDGGSHLRRGSIANNDPNDADVFTDAAYQQDRVRHIVSKWGPAANGGLKYYVLDNDHTLWHSTHRDVGRRASGPPKSAIWCLTMGSKYGWSNLPERTGVLGGMDYASVCTSTRSAANTAATSLLACSRCGTDPPGRCGIRTTPTQIGFSRACA